MSDPDYTCSEDEDDSLIVEEDQEEESEEAEQSEEEEEEADLEAEENEAWLAAHQSEYREFKRRLISLFNDVFEGEFIDDSQADLWLKEFLLSCRIPSGEPMKKKGWSLFRF
jgi:hypothetical protein